jgi:hypothetical protein
MTICFSFLALVTYEHFHSGSVFLGTQNNHPSRVDSKLLIATNIQQEESFQLPAEGFMCTDQIGC